MPRYLYIAGYFVLFNKQRDGTLLSFCFTRFATN